MAEPEALPHGVVAAEALSQGAAVAEALSQGATESWLCGEGGGGLEVARLVAWQAHQGESSEEAAWQPGSSAVEASAWEPLEVVMAQAAAFCRRHPPSST